MGLRKLFRETDMEPHNKPPRHRLLLAPKESKTLAVCVHERTHKYTTHYDVQRSLVLWCCGEPELCPHCQAGRSPKVSFYIGVQMPVTHKVHLLAIPERAYAYARGIHELEGRLRGTVLSISRLRAGARAPVVIAALPGKPGFPRLTEPWDIQEDLARYWNLD